MAPHSKSLDSFFAPKTIAVIGASERMKSVGRTLMNNLLTASFCGTIFPVNPKHRKVCGCQCYPLIGAIRQKIDLAIIATPAKTVPAIIAECVEAKVSSAIIISAGFREEGAEGIEREEQILFHSRGRLRVVGPNCLGIMRPSVGLNATFARGMALPGRVAFISQSGAMCTAMLDWSLREKIGFSAFVSIGSMIDVGWAEMLEYFGRDPETESILIYMESIGDANAFLQAAKQVTRTKPIILLKAGRSAQSAQAAISHTGSLAGNDEVFSTAMQSAHILRVDTISELFHMADYLAKQPLPQGSNLTMISNAGGPSVIATDALVEMGGSLTSLEAKTTRALDRLLSPHRSHNPVDLLGDASAEKFEKAIQIATMDDKSDGILAILAPQDMTDPTETAQRLQPYRLTRQPIMAELDGAGTVEKGRERLNQYQIPQFEFPDMAARVFAMLWKYVEARSERKQDKMPQFRDVLFAVVERIIAQAREEKRTILDEYESKKILEAYGIKAVRTEIVENASAAVKHARKIGFPVVLKVYSRTISHKNKAGGVKLDLRDESSVIEAFEAIQKAVDAKHFSGVTVQPMVDSGGIELICGSTTDEQFGPVIMFGFGGSLVEVINDRALALPPLSRNAARRLIEKTKIYQALSNKTDLKRLEKVLMRFSSLILAHPSIKELDINPLVAVKNHFIALDARIVLQDDLSISLRK